MRWRRGFGALLGVLRYGCLAHCTFAYLGDLVVCAGPSMEPTLRSNDVLVTEHLTLLSPMLRDVRHGDIVIAKNPSNPEQNICKRVTGLPGDLVRGQHSLRRQVVPRGHVWLEGDNSANSSDSRTYGPVPQGLIRSRVLLRVWPVDQIALL